MSYLRRGETYGGVTRAAVLVKRPLGPVSRTAVVDTTPTARAALRRRAPEAFQFLEGHEPDPHYDVRENPGPGTLQGLGYLPAPYAKETAPVRNAAPTANQREAPAAAASGFLEGIDWRKWAIPAAVVGLVILLSRR